MVSGAGWVKCGLSSSPQSSSLCFWGKGLVVQCQG